MKRSLAALSAIALVLSGCSHAVERAQPKYGTWGVDLTHMDRTVRPGDDFFDYSVGSWVKTAQIPADRDNAGVYLDVTDQTEASLRSVVQQAAASNAPAGEIAQKVGDFYSSFMDEAALEAKGVDPVRSDLAAVDGAADKAGLAAPLAELNRAGGETPFPVAIGTDPNQPTRYVAVLWQGGLSFPNRDYYSNPEQDFVDLRAKFVVHAERLLTLAGYPDARAQAAQLLALETKLAAVHWPRDDEDDPQKTRTIMSRPQVETLAAGAPLKAVFDALSIPASAEFQVGMPDVTAKTAQLFADEPLDAWKTYLRYQLLTYYGPYLSKAFDDEVFGFRDRDLSGVEQQRPRLARGVELVSSELKDAVGQLYVQKVFSSHDRDEVRQMVDTFRDVYSRRIAAATWLAPATEKEAQAKLAAMISKVGYPDTWKQYDSVTISKDLIGDLKSADAWIWNDRLAKLGTSVDRSEWSDAVQGVNASYDLTFNDLTFLAGFLQPPYFDSAADPAVNYGEFGATIGHEMSHGFDNQGRQFDSSGALRDWWTPADADHYNRQADKLAAQFDAYEPLPGLHINGQQTLGENLADLVGLEVAYDAYESSLGGKDAPVLDGFTGEQRFFIAYAASWRELHREEAVRDSLLSNVHSPAKYRVNGIVRNIDAWYDAFDVKEGDALYLKPEDRVRIW